MTIDLLRSTKDFLRPFYVQATDQLSVLRDTQISLLATLGLAGALLLIFLVMLWDLSRSKPRDKVMDRSSERHNKKLVQHLIGDSLTDALANNQLSKKDYKYWCSRIAYTFDMPVMLKPKKVRGRSGKTGVDYKKKEILKRIDEDAMINPKIPGPKPGEEVVGSPKPASNIVDLSAILSRSKSAA